MQAAFVLTFVVLFTAPTREAVAMSSLAQGEAALDVGLWEVAEHHFRNSLNDPDLGQSEIGMVQLRLAEVLIQDSRGDEAIELLESIKPQSPEAAYWKAQAYVSNHQPELALKELEQIMADPSSSLRDSAITTAVRIHLDQGKLAETISLFAALSPPFSDAIKLLQAELFIDLGNHARAGEILPDSETLTSEQKIRSGIAKATILHESNAPKEAEAIVRNLLNANPNLGTKSRFHCLLLLADSLHRSGSTEESVAMVIREIDSNPDASTLPAWFSRLIAWMPNPPPPSHPSMAKLADWIPLNELPATGLVPIQGYGAACAWPTTNRDDARAIHSIYARARGLRNMGTPDAKREANALFNRLRLTHADHPLGVRAMIQQAKDMADAGLLEAITTSHEDGLLKGEAAFALGTLEYEQGRPDSAAKWFQVAKANLPSTAAMAVSQNLLIAAPKSADPSAIQTNGSPELALAGALSQPEPKARLDALNAFILAHPNHPSVDQARLAAAETCLAMATPDVSLAQAQLDSLRPETQQTESSRIQWIRLRLADLSGDSEKTIALARSFMEAEPDSQRGKEAAFILGRTLFDSRNFNEARLVIERLASRDDNPARAQAAWLLAARSAALVPTSQSKQEALILFDKAIAAEGPVSPMARLEKARLMIDMNELGMAADALRTWFGELKPNEPLFIPTGLLLAEAIYAQGASHPSSLAEALTVYDKLLDTGGKQPALFNRLQYLRGRVLEQLPDPAKPGNTRTRDAFLAYYSVLEQEPPPAEWNYFELCGFSALAMLEKAERWPAAIACARKIASFKGPRAEEAASRASQLRLNHRIWEE